MQIYVVKPGDTLYSIGRTLSLAPGFLARYNGLQEPYRLAVGQSLLALYPEKAVTVRAGDTLSSIAASAGTDVLSLFRMNPNLSGSDRIYPGQILVTQLEQNRTRSAFVAGYAYPYVQESVLRGILPFTGALMPFTYGFTPEGALVPMDDERLLALAEDYGVRPFLHLSTLTAAGAFSADADDADLCNVALDQGVRCLRGGVGDKDNILGVDVVFFQAVFERLHNAGGNARLVVVGGLDRGFADDLVGRVVDGDGLGVGAADVDAHAYFSFTHFSIPPQPNMTKVMTCMMAQVIHA